MAKKVRDIQRKGRNDRHGEGDKGMNGREKRRIERGRGINKSEGWRVKSECSEYTHKHTHKHTYTHKKNKI